MGFLINASFDVKDYVWAKLQESRRRLWFLQKLAQYTKGLETLILAYQCYVRAVPETYIPLAFTSVSKKMKKYTATTESKAIKIITGGDKQRIKELKKPIQQVIERWSDLVDRYIIWSIMKFKTGHRWPPPRPDLAARRRPAMFRSIRVRRDFYGNTTIPRIVERANELFRRGEAGTKKSLVLGVHLIHRASELHTLQENNATRSWLSEKDLSIQTCNFSTERLIEKYGASIRAHSPDRHDL